MCSQTSSFILQAGYGWENRFGLRGSGPKKATGSIIHSTRNRPGFIHSQTVWVTAPAYIQEERHGNQFSSWWLPRKKTFIKIGFIKYHFYTFFFLWIGNEQFCWLTGDKYWAQGHNGRILSVSLRSQFNRFPVGCDVMWINQIWETSCMLTNEPLSDARKKRRECLVISRIQMDRLIIFFPIAVFIFLPARQHAHHSSSHLANYLRY